MESYQGNGDDEYRGRTGPLRVSENNETGALYDALIKAAGEVGIAYTKDYNGARQDGIGMTQTTIRGGRRMSTAVCYLDPARSRPNLKIQANALTECLLFDEKSCVGVRYSLDGMPDYAYPRVSVIEVSAERRGNTPRLRNRLVKDDVIEVARIFRQESTNLSAIPISPNPCDAMPREACSTGGPPINSASPSGSSRPRTSQKCS